MKIPLTKKQAEIYSHCTNEWVGINVNPANKIIAALEKRGLIEIRVDPNMSPDEAVMATILRSNNQWQWRRKQ